MTGTRWHVDDDTLEGYGSGRVTAVIAASTEAHLTACATCRARLAPSVPALRLDAIWRAVDDRIDERSLPWFERVLVRMGVSQDTARLLAATPSLTSSWLGALTAAIVFAAFAADVSSRGLFAFLTIAPMLPVAGVAAAYGRQADPAYELAVAAPYSMLRLLLVRSVAVVGVTIALTAIGGLVLADSGWTAAAWLLPAIALTSVTLLLSAHVQPVTAATAVLGAWVVAVAVAWQATGSRLAAFGEAGQAVALVITVLCLAALVTQRQAFAFDTRRSA